MLHLNIKLDQIIEFITTYKSLSLGFVVLFGIFVAKLNKKISPKDVLFTDVNKNPEPQAIKSITIDQKLKINSELS